LELVNERIEQVTANTELPPEVKESILKQYAQIKSELESAQKAQAKRQEWTDQAAAAPRQLEIARTEKEEGDRPPENRSSQSDNLLYMSFDEGQRRKQELEAELARAAANRASLTERSTSREKRRKELPQLISETRAKLEQIKNAPVAGKPSDDPLLQEAGGWLIEAAQQNLSEQLQLVESEQRLYEAEAFLLPVQLELAEEREKQLQERLRRVNEQLDKIRADRILNSYSEIKDLNSRLSGEMQVVGKQLLERILTWMELSKNQAVIKTELESARKLLQHWKERRDRMDTRIDAKPGQEGVSGFNSWVGLMLRKQRSELPDPNQLQARIRYYQSEMQQADSMLFDLEDALADVKQQLDGIERIVPTGEIGDSDSSVDGEERAVSGAEQLLAKGEEILGEMKIDTNAYLSDLYDLADVRQNTIELSDDYREFIDKHVLWIRSTEPLSTNDLSPGIEAFRWFVSYENWSSVGRLLLLDFRRHIPWYVLSVCGLLLFIGNQSKLRRALGQLSAKAEKNHCTDFSLTARCLLLTFLVSSPAPLILLCIGWRLQAATNVLLVDDASHEFSKSLARGLILATSVFFPLEFVRQLCRLGGLGIKHFGWREQVARHLSTNLRWLIDFTIPLTAIIGLFLAQSNQRWDSSFGRITFILLMPLLSAFLARVFFPKAGLVSVFLETHRGGWIDRLSVVWYPILILGPIALAAVSIVGYHYTAERIANHSISALWTVVALLTCYFVAMRWLVTSRRKLMIAQARQRLEDASRRGATAETLSVEEPKVDLIAINEQTRRLLSSLVVVAGILAFYLIWSDVLPAVSMLDSVALWEVEGKVPEETVIITLADLLMLVPIVALIVIAGRNVPGLLEIGFLQHLPLTNAVRYAITTLSRYAIFGIGLVIVFSTIGLRWSSVQWLVAALGVGLGFGLQEIFANFVSGLILLFEQPIRVGDIISIDGTTGSVLKIRMRATTIVNWDRQELIVPNKDLITGKLLNWTLTDATNRVVVNVGVAYGTDVARACELIRQVATESPAILGEPRPSVTFEGFGDNALTLVLRAFLESLENRLATIHDLHEQIYNKLNAAGIQISFPQRDLHIRSFPEGWERLLQIDPRDPVQLSAASNNGEN
jgi:potassium efflux system protein